MRHTLPKSSILRGYQRFSRVITKGVFISQPHLSCYVLSAREGTERPLRSAEIGFAVPKRIVPLAVHRNRIKRLMREVVRRHFRTAVMPKNGGTLEIVLMYSGRSPVRDPGVALPVFEKEWKAIVNRINTLP